MGAEFKRTVMIGLGGAGQLILLNVKRHLLDTYGKVPACVNFLSLDTDGPPTKLKSLVTENEIALGPGEFLHMTVDNPAETVKSDPEILNWFVGKGPVGAITNGAGAIRQNGRLALMKNIELVKGEIHRRLDALNAQTLPDEVKEQGFMLAEKPIEVFVCGSIAGGTASGTFLDIGIMMRHYLPNSLIHGFFLLWWPYRFKGHAHRTAPNAYAALCELDHLQSIEAEDKPYEFYYGTELISAKTPPYSLIHLIDGRNEDGQHLVELERVCEETAQAIVLSCSAMSYPVQSVTDNLLAHINSQDPAIWDHKRARYSSFGVSSIYYPAPELHRAVARKAASELCSKALDEVNREASREFRDSMAKAVENKVREDLERLDLFPWERLQNRYFLAPPPGFALDSQERKGEAGDLTSSAGREQAKLEQNLDAARNSQEAEFEQYSLSEFRNRLLKDRGDQSISSLQRRLWLEKAEDFLKGERDKVHYQLTQSDAKIKTSQTDAAALMNEIQALPRGLLRFRTNSEREERVEAWRELIDRNLKTAGEAGSLKATEKALNSAIQSIQAELQNCPVSQRKEQVLIDTNKELSAKESEAFRALDLLRERSNVRLVGNGRWVIGEHDSQVENLSLDYDKFKDDKKITSTDQYAQIADQGNAGLVSLFLNYAKLKFDWILRKEFDVFKAAESLSAKQPAEKIEKHMDDLVRTGQAFWVYDSAKLTRRRQEQYQRIFNIGVPDPEIGRQILDPIISGLKVKYHSVKDHSFSMVPDRYRIWLLSFSAPLPAYFLEGMEGIRRTYEAAMTPTYHIDKRLEFAVPDLFPVTDMANEALRILGMAIVPGIDVIRDEYLRPMGGRGHRFTCSAKSLTQRNYNQDLVWELFSELYKDVSSIKLLREELIKLLNDKVASFTDRTQLIDLIQDHIKRLRDRLNKREFTKLYSARLTNREMAELDDFLKPNGYDMRMDLLVTGKRQGKAPLMRDN